MIVLKSHSSHCFELLLKYELYIRGSVSLPQLLLQLIDTQGERERERERESVCFSRPGFG